MVVGLFLGFSDPSHQLVINTITTIITFLMVFLIQASQNRDTKAIHLKIDELIAIDDKARNDLIRAEDMSEEDVNRIEKEFADLGKVKDNVAVAGTPPQ